MIALARAVLLWERLWPALWPATSVLGLYITAALIGVPGILPGALRSILLLIALICTGYLLFREFQQWKAPGWNDAARRLERDSRLVNRPITERDDRLLAGGGDPLAESLWRAHIIRLLRAMGRLRVASPSPRLAKKDPYALRYAVLLLLLTGFLFAGADWQRRLATAFTIGEGASVSTASVDAWIAPPAYTGWAPLYLKPARALGAPIAVPSGSLLVLRVHGGRTSPHLQMSLAPAGTTADFAGNSRSYGASARISADTHASVREQGGLLAQWRIRAIPDQPPVIAFAAPPTRTERDAVKLSYTAGDDYGVVSARAVIRPLARNTHAALAIDLPLPEASAKTVSETLYRDLTAHPFAGLDVEITLEARDGAGQIGRSKPARMRLPARIFTNPLARALVEQRQALAVGEPRARDRVATVLDALAIDPEKFYANQESVYLGLRTAYWLLRKARSADDVGDVQDLLWQMATALEQGGLLDAAQQLRALQELLSQALARGAPESEIDQLMQRYRQALQHYLEALAQNGARAKGPLPPNAKVIRPEDLAAMLKAIQQLAQTGARAKAQELLSMLQSLLENMHAGAAGSGQGDKQAGEAMKALGDIIGRQRQLLDKSLREGQGAGDPKDGGGKGLAGQQGRLREDLDRALKGFGNRKLSGTDKLGDAGHEMGSAQDALGEQSFDRAGAAQKNALQDLEQAAGQLAQQMMKRNDSGGQEGQDPFGRQEGANGRTGGDTRLPNASELARARQILEELRRRAAQPGRPKEELDYIDRLLRMF
ncbi:MAG TPA: TIGR02302 family protein [Rhizomicrobium sp.]|jgi:uncharacterized protein (TIGR02302 family)|nr:TIGR02302 family protein [Rhizomicrobium sp.]